MWSSTLPRQRPLDPPPPPPHNKSSTLMRHSAKNVDVTKLKSDIEILSQQLEAVRARLESALAEEDEVASTQFSNKLRRDDSMDSRLSTTLFSSDSQDSTGYTATPQPTEHTMGLASRNQELLRLNKNRSLSATHLAHLENEEVRNKRFSMCLPSASPSTSNGIANLRRRETFSKVDEITKELQIRLGKVKRTESLSFGGSRVPIKNVAPKPPPKPVRTFQDGNQNTGVQSATLGRFNSNHKFKYNNPASSSSFMSSSIAFLSMCNHREFVDAINKRFTQGQCWFSRGGQLYFVNPFNNVLSPRCSFYSVIPTITSSLFEAKSSTLFLRGVSGSGKSHIAELVCMDIVNRLDNQGQISSLFKTAITVLRPFLTANNTYNNQCSKAVLHYVFQTKENRLHRISLRHFPIESMSRGCRANIFAMVANDLSEVDKEKYKISGFRLREKCHNYGNLEEIKTSLNTLGIDVSDILKIISACILLNNLNFKNEQSTSEIDNLADLEDASYLLGVSALAMYRFMVSDAKKEGRVIRDNFVTAIYSRTVRFMIEKINAMLDVFPDTYDGTSLVTDSGVSVGTFTENTHIIHVVDIPGYVRSTQNSLNELIVNATNDIVQRTDSDTVHKMLQNVDLATMSNGIPVEQTPKMMRHCAEFFEIHYDMRMMIERNSNCVPPELVNLFDYRSCSFQFIVNLFATDVECLIVDDNFVPSAINWPFDGKTVIQNVMECTRKLQKEIHDTNSQQIICLKSNESLEYARVHENGLGYQLELYRSVVANSCLSSIRVSSMSNDISNTLKLPPPRQYRIKDGRKHFFPQRRCIVIDFQDPSSGVTLKAGEIVRAVGFSGECYLVENGRQAKATIPLSFTEKCLIAPQQV